MVLLGGNGFAQQNYLSSRISYEALDVGVDVIVSDSGYIFLDHFIDDSSRVGFQVIYTDWNLFLQLIKKYVSIQYSIYCGRHGVFEYNNEDSIFYFGGYKGSSDAQMVLYKFNNQGDTLWTKEYGNFYYQAGQQTKMTRDHGFITVLIEEDSIQGYGISLVKSDPVGNISWVKSFPRNRLELAFSIDTTYDGGFILTGGSLNYGVPAGSDCMQVYFIKTDSLGNVQWRKTFGGPYYDIAWRVIQTVDSGFVAAGFYTVIDSTPPIMCDNGLGLTQPYFIKLNSNGDSLWTRRYGEPHYITSVRVVRELSNGDFIAVGMTRNDSTNAESGLIVKISSSGDSLWYHTYKYLYSPTAKNHLYDIRETPDGGFIATGFTSPHASSVQDTGRQDTWILKVDSNGCEVFNCLTSSIENFPIDDHSLIYPNPSYGVFYFNQNIKEFIECRLYNNAGPLVFSSSSILSEIDLSNYPAGIYYFQIISHSGVRYCRLIKM
jgi:hypothetical protein